MSLLFESTQILNLIDYEYLYRLIKLIMFIFVAEEYTKITTPRQDILFRKGYFGRRKFESSIEESTVVTPGKPLHHSPRKCVTATSGGL